MKLKLSIFILSFFVLTACEQTVIPATGEQTRSVISSQQEQQIGDREHQNIIKAYGGVVNDPNIAGYVASIGGRLAAVSEMPNAKWTFTVLDSPVVNAFALPGGYVYVTRGLLALANDEAELAGVLGHEIGHVTARHPAQRQTQGTVAQVGSILAAIGLQIAGVDGSGQLGKLLQTGAQGYVASFSRSQELEADQLGIRYLTRAGYDPQAQADFLTHLGAETALSARLSGKSYDPTQVEFLQTHPATPQRVEEARQIARSLSNVQGVGNNRNKNTYLTTINNMIYGDSASQGFVRGRTFAHTELGFIFTVPEGFKLDNLPDRIVATNAQNTQIVVDSVPSKGTSPAQYLQSVWLPGLKQQTNVSSLSDYAEFTTNGLPAATGRVQIATQRGDAYARLITIGLNNAIYRIIALYDPRSDQFMTPEMQKVAYSFRALSQAERGQFVPYRLRVRPYNGESLTSIAARTPFNELAVDRLRVLNGLTSGQTLQNGQLFKTVE
jgi:predicted Zn-dependent protease